MPVPDHPQDSHADAAHIGADLPPEAAADHQKLTWTAAGYLNAHVDGHGQNPDLETLRAYRRNFLVGRELCRAGAAATTPATADLINEGHGADHLYVLTEGTTPEMLEAALVETAAAIGLNTYTPHEVHTLADLLPAIYTVCTDLAERVQKHARPLTTEEWSGLDNFFIRGLFLVAAGGGTKPRHTGTDPPC